MQRCAKRLDCVGRRKCQKKVLNIQRTLGSGEQIALANVFGSSTNRRLAVGDKRLKIRFLKILKDR